MFTTPFAFMAAPAGGGWTPADLPGVYLWLDAADGITTSGGLVTDWTDKISSKTFTSSTTDKFTYTVSDSDFNNNPSLYWFKGSGTTPACKLTNSNISYGGEDLFYWAVYYIPTAIYQGESMIFSIAGAGGFDYQTMFFTAGSTNPEYLILGGGPRNVSSTAISKDVPILFLGRRINSSPYTNTLWNNSTTSQSLDQSGTFSSATLTGTIGNEAGGGGFQYQFGGKIAELGWCKGTVSDGDASNLITYLTAKYNIILI